MKTTLGQKIIESLEEFHVALTDGEPLEKRFTCRRVVLDLEPSAYGPAEVRRARAVLGASQAVFARFLGVSRNTVRAWEQGKNVPSEIARRFMDEIRRDPHYWQRRLQQAATVKKAAPFPAARGSQR